MRRGVARARQTDPSSIHATCVQGVTTPPSYSRDSAYAPFMQPQLVITRFISGQHWYEQGSLAEYGEISKLLSACRASTLARQVVVVWAKSEDKP